MLPCCALPQGQAWLVCTMLLAARGRDKFITAGDLDDALLRATSPNATMASPLAVGHSSTSNLARFGT